MDKVKKLFTKIIKYININKIKLDEKHSKELKELIIKWNKPNKTMNDYFDMKNNHTYLTKQLDKYSKELDDLWMVYLEAGLKERVTMMRTMTNNLC